jgi:hypothetical protein
VEEVVDEAGPPPAVVVVAAVVPSSVLLCCEVPRRSEAPAESAHGSSIVRG